MDHNILKPKGLSLHIANVFIYGLSFLEIPGMKEKTEEEEISRKMQVEKGKWERAYKAHFLRKSALMELRRKYTLVKHLKQ